MIDDLAHALTTRLHFPTVSNIFTFRVSRRQCEMYCGHMGLCVCVTLRGRMPT